MTQRVFWSLLIVFFTAVLVGQLVNSLSFSCLEGMDNATPTAYKEYDTTNPNNAMILAQQNAGNIIVLKGQLDDVMKIKQQVNDLSAKVDQLSSQMDALVQQQADYAQDLAGSTPPDVTGTDV